MRALSRWAGFKGGETTYKVLTKLKEIGLFTDTVGSVPLSRSLIDLDVEQEKERMKMLSHTDVPYIPTRISAEETQKPPPVPPEGISESPTEDDDPPFNPPPSSAEIDVETRLKFAEGQIKQLERTTAAGFEDLKKILTEVINPLSGAPTADNPISETPPSDNPLETPVTEDPSDSVEDRLERIEGLLQERSESDPFADLDRDQILELIRSQPKEFMAMVNPPARAKGVLMHVKNVRARAARASQGFP